jgi:hypothetical protein
MNGRTTLNVTDTGKRNMINKFCKRSLLVLPLLLLTAGCQPAQEESVVETDASASSKDAVESQNAKADSMPVSALEVTAEQLLGARLPQAEVAEGWIRLFDGHTLFGWQVAGDANWRVEDGSIVVDDGEACLLCTSVPWQNFELVLEYKADAETNSGVFLRTHLSPENPAEDCYEVNIAPTDNPFPTGGIVKRKKATEFKVDSNDWHTMKLVLDGERLQVSVDGNNVCDYTDEVGVAEGRIGLQHNSGRIEFRDIRLRPLGLKSLLDDELTQWTKYPEMPGEFTVTEQGDLRVKGGRTQLESKQPFDDFVLLAEYKLPLDEMNSGIFFRCIPGDVMMGYECQLSNEIKDGDRLKPADCGTGGIFRRQDARVVAGETDQFATVVLVAHGPSIAAWVNGVQVSDWYDDRKSDENPRRGLRLKAGTFMIQGHDPGTDALIRQFNVATVGDANQSE